MMKSILRPALAACTVLAFALAAPLTSVAQARRTPEQLAAMLPLGTPVTIH